MSHHTHTHMEDGPHPIGRRGFLKLTGFSLAGTALAGCRRPVEKAIPFLVQPEELVPGQAVWYASTCGGCNAGCGVLVKNRDGRPIKLEGNPAHPLSAGGLCAIGQACIVGLYDSRRLADPLEGKSPSPWPQVDRKIIERLERVRREGKALRLLTGTITSPSTQATIDRFLGTFPDARHVCYDALSASAILDAHERTHGRRVLPRFCFERAEVIVSLDADFLGTWISPVEFTTGYRRQRSLERTAAERGYHAQFESRLSLTGAKADTRTVVAPDAQRHLAASLAAAVAQKAGRSDLPAIAPDPRTAQLVERLWNARGKSLVISGVNDVETQIWVNLTNHLLGNYPATLDIDSPSQQSLGDDRSLKRLMEELRAGQVGALVVSRANPVYELPDGPELAELMRQVPLVLSTAEHLDETGRLAHFVCPEPHFLERWDDARPTGGLACITQPVIQRLGRTRTLIESLTTWMGEPASDYDAIRTHWQENLYPLRARSTESARDTDRFQAFWDQCVHDGFAALAGAPPSRASFDMSALPAAHSPWSAESGSAETWLVLYPKVTLRDGRHTRNPWLQELPDPITRVAWDNYACLSPGKAEALGVQEGDVIVISPAGAGTQQGFPLELPVVVQPGQHDDVIAVALGYGQVGSERFADIGPEWIEARSSVGPDGRVGRNAAPLLCWAGDHLAYALRVGSVSRTGRRQTLAAIQTYHSLDMPPGTTPAGQERRDIVREMTLQDHAETVARGPASRPAPPSLWPEHRYEGHRWGMAIDLDACTGCGACVLACQIENNIPVVGKDEMRRGREMHWLRIDRYYRDTERREDAHEQRRANATDTVSVSFQPMLCHHCENAPCETVCPVLATVHSEEGLNQQVYNRCVGTRYCANNCPYKMRRFNWFDYAHDDAMENMILNPDVTVRSRGVMEKCSFCVQRIQAAKIEAKRNGVAVRDGDVQAACQQSCPAAAIVFGDLNDPDSRISRLQSSPRYYRLLEELNVRPAVGYLMVVREDGQGSGGAHHG